MEKTKYDIEEGLKKKLLRIKNSNYSKQGKINQEKIAKKAAEDARKAMRENYRQQQVNNFVQLFVLPTPWAFYPYRSNCKKFCCTFNTQNMTNPTIVSPVKMEYG